MKYKEITIYTYSPSVLAEELSAAGYAQLIINDPADLEVLEKDGTASSQQQENCHVENEKFLLHKCTRSGALH